MKVAMVRDLTRERDTLKIRVKALEKENSGLAQENLAAFKAKDLLVDVCKDALSYIDHCDEPWLARGLRAAINMGEGREEVRDSKMEWLVVWPEQQGGDPVAG